MWERTFKGSQVVGVSEQIHQNVILVTIAVITQTQQINILQKRQHVLVYFC